MFRLKTIPISTVNPVLIAQRINKTPTTVPPSAHVITDQPEHQDIIERTVISIIIVDTACNHNIPVRGNRNGFPPIIPFTQLHDDHAGIPKTDVRGAIPIVSQNQHEQIVSVRSIARNNDSTALLQGQSSTVVISFAAFISNNAVYAETAIQYSIGIES